jgi:hypothetical protein
MSFELLQQRIRENIDYSEGKELSQFRHLNTALNNLIKKDITNAENITLALGDDLENTLKKYRTSLVEEGKSDLKSPLTRVRRLSEYYQTIYNLNVDELSFSELLKTAVERKYGSNLWTGPVTPKTQAKILSKHVTYRTVARDMIVSAIKEDPMLWQNVSLEANGPLGSASKHVRDYMTGESIPSERVPDSRIHYMEKFLFLPKNSLLSKIKRKIDHNNRGKKENEKSISHVNRKTIIIKELNANLQKVFNEYSAYKIDKRQPKIINISEKLKESIYFELNVAIKEVNRKKDKWTINAKNKCGAQSNFMNQLLDFQNYCINSENLSYDEVGTKHMTDPLLLGRMVSFYKIQTSGSTSISRLLNWISRGIQNQGYLRFCGDMNEKSFEEYNHALEVIDNKYSEWLSDLSDSIKSTGSNDALKGKDNIKFLLKYDVKSRMNLVHQATRYLVDRAINLQIEAHYKIKISKKITAPVAKESNCKSAASNIRKAMNYIQAAVIQEVSFYNCPRSINWTMLKYYENAKLQDMTFSSLTYLRQKNRFQLFIPRYGTSIIDPNMKNLRYLKNADSKGAVNVDVELPEHLTPLIKKLIEIRSDYIKMDLAPYANIDADSFDILLPWRSIRGKSVKDPIKAKSRRLCIAEESKLSENYQSMTYVAYLNVAPDEKQHGINHHGTRHLAAETYLKKNPGDFIGAAAMLNDEVEQIIKTYGDKDRAAAMRRVAKSSSDISYF